MGVQYSKHLNERLKERGIPKEVPRDIYNTSTERYRDTWQNSEVAIKNILIKKTTTKLVIAYVKIDKNVTIKTIHPIDNYQIRSRIRNKRWIKI